MQKTKFKSDLKARYYKFSLNIIFLINTLDQKSSVWIIGNQLIKSATSICANLVEARAVSSRLEFKRFHEISLRSANETKYWLELLRDANLANKQTVNNLISEVTEIASMLASSVLRLKGKKF